MATHRRRGRTPAEDPPPPPLHTEPNPAGSGTLLHRVPVRGLAVSGGRGGENKTERKQVWLDAGRGAGPWDGQRPAPAHAGFISGWRLQCRPKPQRGNSSWRFAGASRRHQPCPRLSGAGTAFHGSITTATPQGILSLRPLAQNPGQRWQSRFNHTPQLPAEVFPAPRGSRVSSVHMAAGNACPVTALSPVSPCPGVLLGSPSGTHRQQLGS